MFDLVTKMAFLCQDYTLSDKLETYHESQSPIIILSLLFLLVSEVRSSLLDFILLCLISSGVKCCVYGITFLSVVR